MSIDAKKFNKMVDVEGLKKDVAEAQENGGTGEYREVPHGNYEVQITKIELGETGENSKNPGSPMVKIWFKITEGEYKNSILFMNQPITLGFQIHSLNEFLKTLDSGVNVVFDDYVQYDQMLLDIAEEIEKQKLGYVIEYGERKGYNTFKVIEVFEFE